MFTVIYILEMTFNSSDPYVLRVSRRTWRTREDAQEYADGVAKDRKAFVVQLPETYTP